MKTIRELLAAKGDAPIYSVTPDATVFDAVTKMVEYKVGAMLVMEGERIAGIVTERDYLRFIAAKGRTARDTPVSEIMTAKVIYVTTDTQIDHVMAIMTERRIRHMPVLAEEKLLGIISIGDLVKQISRDQKVHIQELIAYISDSYPGRGTAGD